VSNDIPIALRQWVAEALITKCINPTGNAKSAGTKSKFANPAYRVAEDVRLAIEPLVELTIELINAVISAATFVGILVIVGGSMNFSLAGWSVTVPGYLAFAALIYSSLVSTLTFKVGGPLVRRVAQKNEAEAQFLFELTRAVDRGAFAAQTFPSAPSGAVEAFQQTVAQWKRVIREHCRLTWIINSSSFFAPILPLLLAAPKYVHGEMSLGAMMQVATAFTIVVGALNWFSDNYIRLAEGAASAKRVDELHRLLERAAGNK
jgi:vitamin B12/bleomycin/antimicrobial peptide transport system ATP-binding/permease protein